jgi:hypothetical protein
LSVKILLAIILSVTFHNFFADCHCTECHFLKLSCWISTCRVLLYWGVPFFKGFGWMSLHWKTFCWVSLYLFVMSVCSISHLKLLCWMSICRVLLYWVPLFIVVILNVIILSAIVLKVVESLVQTHLFCWFPKILSPGNFLIGELGPML